jgi:hypothetical protein
VNVFCYDSKFSYMVVFCVLTDSELHCG